METLVAGLGLGGILGFFVGAACASMQADAATPAGARYFRRRITGDVYRLESRAVWAAGNRGEVVLLRPERPGVASPEAEVWLLGSLAEEFEPIAPDRLHLHPWLLPPLY